MPKVLSIEDLIARVRDGDTAKKVAAAETLGNRAADGSDAAIVQAGGIRPLVDLARNGSGMGKQAAACALAQISFGGFLSNIFEAGGIEPLVELARSGSEDAKKWAASALGDLARLADASEAIKEADGVGALVELVRSGGAHAKAWAAEGLGNLAGHGPAYCTAIRQADGEQALRKLSSSGGKKAKNAEKALAKLSPAAAKLSVEELVARVRDGLGDIWGDGSIEEEAAEKLGDRAADAADGAEACAAIVQADGVRPLVDLARNGSGMGKQWAAYALSELSARDFSRSIFEAGGIGPLVKLARSGSEDAKKWAAQALGYLARLADASEAIKEADGVGALVELVRSGGAHAKEWAAYALAKISAGGVSSNIFEAGGIEPLVELARSGSEDGKKWAASALGYLARLADASEAIKEADGVGALVELVRSGDAHAKAWAAEGLGNLAGHGPAYCTAIRQADGEQALRKLSSSGGKKAKNAEKALAEMAAPASASGKKKLKASQQAHGSKKQNMGSASPFPTMSRDEMAATHECLFGSSPGSNTDDDELRSRLIEFVKRHEDGWKAALAAALHTSVFQFLTSCGRTDADAKRVASARLQSCSTEAAQRAMWDKLSSEYCPRAPAPPDRSSAGKVLVIAPGFGIMATPAQLRTLQRAYGSAVVCSNQHANPEEADFDMAAGILPILHEIRHHQPKAILCASKGGLYMRELWRCMEAGGHDHLKGIAYLMINAPPDLTQLPQGVKIILVQGAKEEKWPRLRGYLNNGRVVDSSLEALVRTGSPGMCYLYYTAEVNSNWGYRKGDTHVPVSLLQHDCLPRLVDSLLATSSSPGAAFQASSRAFLSPERLVAENGLGWHPEVLSSRFEGTEMRVEVQRGSDEFKNVECIFKADPASGVDRFYFPDRGTSNFKITKIERVQNAALKDTVDGRRGRVVKMLESAGIRYKAGVHSRWLFHGAKDADALQNIIENPVSGFAPQMGLGAGGVNLWGYGTYFARDASYSIRAHYCDECLDEQEDRMILLCLVECGLSCVGEEHMRIMPKVHPALKQLPYTSYVDFASNPEIFVTMGEQAYPAYIIHFEE